MNLRVASEDVVARHMVVVAEAVVSFDLLRECVAEHGDLLRVQHSGNMNHTILRVVMSKVGARCNSGDCHFVPLWL